MMDVEVLNPGGATIKRYLTVHRDLPVLMGATRRYRIVQAEGVQWVERLAEAICKDYLHVRQDIGMSAWEVFLDKFLHDTELPVLAGAGLVSREDALAWAEGQYDAFAERRRIAAEQDAEARYVEDLRSSAKVLETKRTRQSAGKKRQAKGRKQGPSEGSRT